MTFSMDSTEIIAEIGWNFMGDMELAEQMIKAAKAAGADIAKFQYWNPETLKAGAWDNDGRREIYNKAALNESKIKQLNSLCQKHDIDCLIISCCQLLSPQDFVVTTCRHPENQVSQFQLQTNRSSRYV